MFYEGDIVVITEGGDGVPRTVGNTGIVVENNGSNIVRVLTEEEGVPVTYSYVDSHLELAYEQKRLDEAIVLVREHQARIRERENQTRFRRPIGR